MIRLKKIFIVVTAMFYIDTYTLLSRTLLIRTDRGGKGEKVTFNAIIIHIYVRKSFCEEFREMSASSGNSSGRLSDDLPAFSFAAHVVESGLSTTTSTTRMTSTYTRSHLIIDYTDQHNLHLSRCGRYIYIYLCENHTKKNVILFFFIDLIRLMNRILTNFLRSSMKRMICTDSRHYGIKHMLHPCSVQTISVFPCDRMQCICTP